MSIIIGLPGGSDSDQFVFDTPIGGVDIITDFGFLGDSQNKANVEGDKIILTPTFFGDELTSKQALSSLKPDQFVVETKAVNSSNRLIYNSNNGNLYFDSDGIGEAKQTLFANLFNQPDLMSSDFYVGIPDSGIPLVVDLPPDSTNI